MIEQSMPLSKNFTLGELLYSPTAERDQQLKAEQENPPDEILGNLQYLVEIALQPIRTRMAFPIHIRC
jgi:DNA mismatch repair protein MutH